MNVWVIFYLLISFCVADLPRDVHGQSIPASSSSAEAPWAFDRMAEGNNAFDRGNFGEAIRRWEAAAGLFEAKQNTAGTIEALVRMSDGYRALGQYPGAFENLNHALALAGDDQNRRAMIFGSLGQLHYLSGNPEQADHYLNQGLALAREFSNPVAAASILNSLGTLHASAKAYGRALDAYLECIAISSREKQPGIAARGLINAARVACETKDFGRAELFLDKALQEIKLLEDTHEKAFTLISTGRLFARIGQGRDAGASGSGAMRSAYEAFKLAEDLAGKLDDPAAAAYAVGYLGRLYEAEQRFDEALELTRRAVFEAQRAYSHESLYLWEWQAGRLLKHQGKIDAAVAAYRRAVSSIQIVREDLSQKCRQGIRVSFRETVGPVYFELADLLLERSAKEQDAAVAQNDLVEARDTVEKLKTVELQDYFQDECVTALRSKVSGLDRIDPHTAALYPILLPERTVLLLSLPDGIKQFVVEAGVKTVTSEVRRFRKKLQIPDSRYIREAKKLYQWLILPVQAELKRRQIQTLIFVPDGPLRTIPMAALHDGKEFLISHYTVVTTPGLTLTDPRPIRRENLNLLVNGLTESVQGFPPLPNVSRELRQIDQLFRCTVLQDRGFKVEKVTQELESRAYSVVHIASHGQFHSDPDKTFILTYDGRLTMGHLERLMGLSRFRKDPVELLTLSACQTAAGDDRAALGLAGVALKSGARSAVATLWFVDDEATSQLITEFYRLLLDPTVSKARALQLAQIQMMNESRFRHPAYWAPFLLIGNWL